jgi:tRNA(His) 5'-end guanylyltransferase
VNDARPFSEAHRHDTHDTDDRVFLSLMTMMAVAIIKKSKEEHIVVFFFSLLSLLLLLKRVDSSSLATQYQ